MQTFTHCPWNIDKWVWKEKKQVFVKDVISNGPSRVVHYTFYLVMMVWIHTQEYLILRASKLPPEWTIPGCNKYQGILGIKGQICIHLTTKNYPRIS